MKNRIVYMFIFAFAFAFSCKAQTYPLRTYKFKFSENSYQMDTNNELPSYEGTWKGTWDNKIIYIINSASIKKYFYKL